MLKLRWMLILSLVMSMAAIGCDDSTGNDDNNSDMRDAPDLGDVDPETSRIEVVEPSSGTMEFSTASDANLTVRYVTADGIGIPDATLAFAIIDSQDGNGAECHTAGDGDPCVEVSAFTSATNGDGEASITVRNPSGSAADATIEVTVEGVDSVPATQVPVVIRSKDTFDLIVNYEYTGGRSFEMVAPALFEIGAQGNYMSCADVVNANPPREEADIASITRAAPSVERNQDGSIPSVRFIVPNNTTWIASGWALTEQGLINVFGCNDEGAAGGGNEITVVLQDTPIEFAEVYQLTSNFDLLSGLPRRATDMDSREAGDWVDLVVGLFSAPGDTLFELLGPVIEDIGGIDIPDGLEPVAGQLIDDAIAEFAPGWLNNILVVGGDISELATSLQLNGEFRITSQADPETGILAMGQEHVYNGVNFRWRLPCVQGGMTADDCNGARTGLTFAELGKPDLAVSGTWDGAVVECADGDGQCLVINQHGMTVPYGEIILAVIEGYVLPEFFGAQVTSLEDFVDRVLLQFIVDWYNNNNPGMEVTTMGCEAVGEVLANSLSEDGFANGVLQSIGEFACDTGRDELVGLVDDLAADLSIDTADNLLLETSGDCELQDTDGDLVWDLIGENLSEDRRCDWGIKFRWDAMSDQVDLNGKFHAGTGQ